LCFGPPGGRLVYFQCSELGGVNRQVFRSPAEGGPKSGLVREQARAPIELGAYVGVFRLLERILIVGRGDGAVAAQTYGITGAVVVGNVLEGEPGCVLEYWESLGGQKLASIPTPERPEALVQVYALGVGRSDGIRDNWR
jgi:hypothetical protein